MACSQIKYLFITRNAHTKTLKRKSQFDNRELNVNYCLNCTQDVRPICLALTLTLTVYVGTW